MQAVRAVGDAVRADALHVHLSDAVRARAARTASPRCSRRTACPVGFSDHTLGNFMAFAAVALGANLFEKHFTVSRSLPGPDQQGSMEPRGARRSWCEAFARSSRRAAPTKTDSARRAGRPEHGAAQRRVDPRHRRGRDDRRRRRLGEAAGHRHSRASARRGDRPGGEARHREGSADHAGTISRRCRAGGR